ncbi:MAG: hypothetical protein Q8N82_07175 [Deltaproteobacteria bacterium]|nr:hypothetical protein [Deltaproteobacteria bacterium]
MTRDEPGKGSKFPETEVKGTIRDFVLPIVEFLGILVPGVIFIFAFFPAVIVPLASILQIVENSKPTLPLIADYFIKIFISPTFGTIFILSVFSYVTGHLFFRQDPKIPDKHSFMKARETIKEEGPVRLCDNEKQYNMENGIPIDEYNLEFPYRYLREYLHDRGMIHLSNIIPWKGTDPKTYKMRTKHFINIIKVRLEFLFPYQYLRIQRNEAHVRLMSSMWYASNSLIYAAIIGAIIGMLAIFISVYVTNSAWPIPYFSSVVAPIFVLVLAILVRRSIESFLHYQRIREVVFILEAAYFAKKVYPEFEFMEQYEVNSGDLKGASPPKS